jgi:hypothetical protein
MDEEEYYSDKEIAKRKKEIFPECKRTYGNTPIDKNKDIKIDCFKNKERDHKHFLEYKYIDGKLKYNVNHLNINIHWGQRKLFLSEIIFLNECYNLYNNKEEKVFIYAGAAGGHHLVLLSIMFPDIKLLLYDPAKFAIKENNKIKIFNQYFTQDTANELKKYKNALFCSDIRRDASDDNMILEDMKWQSDWVKTINPHASLLKFRGLWPKNNDTKNKENYFKYLDGDLYMQQYAPVKSTEMRLLSKRDIHKYNDKEYSKIDIEESCFFFNQVVRQNYYYDHKYECISHHYDGMAEIKIWEEYLKQHNIKITPKKVCKLISLLTDCIMNPDYNRILNKFNEIIKDETKQLRTKQKRSSKKSRTKQKRSSKDQDIIGSRKIHS